MRITAGHYRGRSVHCPSGQAVRPTSSKVRQAFFNILATRVRGASFLDIFAGTGLMGFEALSRGAGHVTFVEEAKQQGRAIQETIDMFAAADSEHKIGEAELILGDFRRVLPGLKGAGQYDLIWADPPYKQKFGGAVIALVESHSLLKNDGLIIIEHLRDDILPDTSPDGTLEKRDCRSYGQTTLTFFGGK